MGLEVAKEKPKVKALLIARKQYKNLLNPLYKDYDINIRRIIGRKKSLSVLTERLDDYSEQTFFVIDINAVIEKGKALTDTLARITKKRRDLRLILFAPESKPGDSDIDFLVGKGFENIIVNSADNAEDKWNGIINDLCLLFERQHLSPEKISQLINPKPNPQIMVLSNDNKEKNAKVINIEQNAADKKKIEKGNAVKIPNYGSTYASLSFYGTQKRIGATCAALITAAYFVKGKASALVYFATEREYKKFIAYYDNKTAVADCITEINGIYLTFSGARVDNEQEFNIIIKDSGVLKDFDTSSRNVVVGGIGYNEIAAAIKAYKSLEERGIDYIPMISLAEGKPVGLFPDKRCIAVPYAGDLTVFPDGAAEAFNSAFEGLASSG